MGWLVFPATILLFLAGPPLLVAAAVVDLRAKRRSAWPKRLGYGGIASIAASLALFAFHRHVELALDLPWLWRVQARAEPIVDALERHRAERGSLPGSLEALVPVYLARMPRPGFGSDRFELDLNYGGEVGLYVDCSRLLSFDQYIHAPHELAVESEGRTTRFGDWVYYDE